MWWAPVPYLPRRQARYSLPSPAEGPVEEVHYGMRQDTPTFLRASLRADIAMP